MLSNEVVLVYLGRWIGTLVEPETRERDEQRSKDGGGGGGRAKAGLLRGNGEQSRSGQVVVVAVAVTRRVPRELNPEASQSLPVSRFASRVPIRPSFSSRSLPSRAVRGEQDHEIPQHPKKGREGGAGGTDKLTRSWSEAKGGSGRIYWYDIPRPTPIVPSHIPTNTAPLIPSSPGCSVR